MHRIGGVYFDADVLCYRPAEDLWAGADVVLQVGLHGTLPLASIQLTRPRDC